jgi:cytochrome c oxidase subunit 2
MIKRLCSCAALVVLVMLTGLVASDNNDIVRLVEELTYDPLGDVEITNMFVDPASDIAELGYKDGWFALWVFLPFLILPELLLLYVIVKFRDRDENDTRQPATFMENHKLEITYTIIPIIALVIVSIPVAQNLAIVEYAPEVPAGVKEMEINVIGKQYEWKYQYPGFADGDTMFTVSRDDFGAQRPVVLVKGWTTHMFFTSEDVMHAWSVPAFGVKKDCYPVVQNFAWFTPKIAGKYEGQCYELCGADHGKMVISAIVLEDEADFYKWIAFQHNYEDAIGVVEAVRSLDNGAPLSDDIKAAVQGYVAKSGSEARIDSLLYWTYKSFYKESLAQRGADAATASAALLSLGQERLDQLQAAVQSAASVAVAHVPAAQVEG